jgi:hypothetical protein
MNRLARLIIREEWREEPSELLFYRIDWAVHIFYHLRRGFSLILSPYLFLPLSSKTWWRTHINLFAEVSMNKGLFDLTSSWCSDQDLLAATDRLTRMESVSFGSRLRFDRERFGTSSISWYESKVVRLGFLWVQDIRHKPSLLFLLSMWSLSLAWDLAWHQGGLLTYLMTFLAA